MPADWTAIEALPPARLDPQTLIDIAERNQAQHLAVQRVFGGLFNAGPDFAHDGRQFDHLFDDGEVFHIGGLQARAMHTPGHTPACMTYVVADGTQTAAFVVRLMPLVVVLLVFTSLAVSASIGNRHPASSSARRRWRAAGCGRRRSRGSRS